MTNSFEITEVAPSNLAGNVVVEGYINDEIKFNVNIKQSNHAIDYITLNAEIVWVNNPSLLDEAIVNPIELTLLDEFRNLVATKIRTIRARN
ncbi:hypothetical protein [Sporosarcina psychrophila]|uniref:Uncharacterized protein n=1 Tax=Sporosarcina psychrophila TaxID=1476 RepID=A0ABV2KBR3_SPOPS